MKKENLINEIKRISTLMLISNKNNFIYESLNENKKSLLNEGIPPLEPLIDKFVSSYEKLERNAFKSDLSAKINRQTTFQTFETNLSGKLREILNQAKNMTNLPADVLDIILPLYKINSQKDKTFAKSMSDGLYVEFERVMNSPSYKPEDVIADYTRRFGENVVKNLKVKHTEKTFEDLFNFQNISKITPEPLTAKEVDIIKKNTSSGFKNILKGSVEKLIIDVNDIYKLVNSLQHSTSDGKDQTEIVLNAKLENFAKSYNVEFQYLINVFTNQNAPAHVKELFEKIKTIPSVSRKMEVMAGFTDNITLIDKLTSICKNIKIGLKNAGYDDILIYPIYKKIRKPSPPTEDELVKQLIDKTVKLEDIHDLGTISRTLKTGWQKGYPTLKNPLWQKALIKYGKQGVRTQAITELLARMMKYQLMFSFYSVITGLLASYNFRKQLKSCKKACAAAKKDKSGNLTKVPKECRSGNPFYTFVFMRVLKIQGFTQDDYALNIVKNLVDDIFFNASKSGEITKYIPGIYDDVFVFLSENYTNDFGEDDEESNGGKTSKMEAKLLELLNELNKDVEEELKANNEENPNVSAATETTTGTTTTPVVVYKNNEPSFIEFLKTKNPTETFKSYNEDTDSGKNSEGTQYRFIDGNFVPVE